MTGPGGGGRTSPYKRVDGHEVLADVWLPAGTGPHPVVLYLHGGGLIMGGRSWVPADQRDALLEDGIAVVSADYRLAPETTLPGIAQDLDDAVAWVRGDGARRLGLDPRRLAVMGGSAGGYLSLLAGMRVRPRLAAVVAFYGYGDILGAWYTRASPFYLREPLVAEPVARAAVGSAPVSDAADDPGRRAFYLFCRQQGRWPREVGGVDPDLHREALEAFCPVRHVDAGHPPTLLLHGDEDTDVPYEQSVDMAAAFAAAGVRHELITIHGGPHGFDSQVERPDVAAALVRVRSFLADALLPARGPA